MSNYDWLHEAEDVSLVAGGARQCSDLRPLLLSLGFIDELESCARELRERGGEPGAKEVAITIKRTYPRR